MRARIPFSRAATRKVPGLVLMIGALWAAPAVAGAEDEGRVAGGDRIETAVELSRQFASADTVVVARSDEYADALAGAPLASSLDAPILLTHPDGLTDTVEVEIARLGADDAVLLGGQAALSAQVERELEGLGLAAERVDGEDRFDTAAQIAERLPDPDRAYVVRGIGDTPDTGWEDAVAVSALAAFEGNPILLSTTDALPDATRTALETSGIEDARLVGGPAVLSSQVTTEVAEALDLELDPNVAFPIRWAGDDRYSTSTIIADESMRAGMDPSTVWVATGRDYPDSLAAAPLVGATTADTTGGGVLLLIDGADLDRSAASQQWLEANADDIDRLRAVGGPAVITDETLETARATAGLD